MSNTEQPYDLIYENYKEPLKKIPKSEGYGYYGTIATTADKTLIQCHFCGELFSALGNHVLWKHQMTIYDYKEHFGLSKTSALVADSVRVKRQELAVRPWKGELPQHLETYTEAVRNGEVIHRDKDGDSRWSLERRNIEGLCPDQVLAKIQELTEKLGHAPSEEEFKHQYKGKYLGPMRTLFGSYLKAVKKAGLVSAKELKEPSDERLLQDLIDFKKEHGRIPMTSDFKRGLLSPRAMYYRRFGSLNNARVEAGLDAVLPLPFGQVITLPPDEYRAYKQKQVSDKAIAGTVRRKLATT